jgi:hypothetical protein
MDVNAENYGITPEEIILMTDKELNSLLSRKRLAPYKLQVLIYAIN